MIRVDFRDAYKETVKNQKIALAVMPNFSKSFNLITLEWFMKTSITPPMYAISIGHERFSFKCLQNCNFFNLVFPDISLIKQVRYFGSESGYNEDKLEKSGINWFKGRLAGLPIIEKAVVNFECRIVTQVRSGDHTIFVGEVKKSWLNKENHLLLREHLSPK